MSLSARSIRYVLLYLDEMSSNKYCTATTTLLRLKRDDDQCLNARAMCVFDALFHTWAPSLADIVCDLLEKNPTFATQPCVASFVHSADHDMCLQTSRY